VAVSDRLDSVNVLAILHNIAGPQRLKKRVLHHLALLVTELIPSVEAHHSAIPSSAGFEHRALRKYLIASMSSLNASTERRSQRSEACRSIEAEAFATATRHLRPHQLSYGSEDDSHSTCWMSNMSRSCGSDRVQSSHGSHHGTAGCADPSSCGIVGVCEIDTWLVEAYQRDMR
jgi:hypothetical protein